MERGAQRHSSRFKKWCRPFLPLQFQYLVEAPLAAITAASLLGYDATSLALVFGEFLPFLSADPLKVCQGGWVALLHSFFQVPPDMFEPLTAGMSTRAAAENLTDLPS